MSLRRGVGRLRLCGACGAMLAAPAYTRLSACPCGALAALLQAPGLAPWKLSPFDRRFLRSLRIGTGDTDAPHLRPTTE